MANIIDISGQKFNRWTVEELVGRTTSGGGLWKCRCECGTVRNVDGRSLRDGTSKSCGCLRNDNAKAGKYNSARAVTHERLYGVWSGIRSRCLNPHDRAYERYGGRGITICDQWKDYRTFYNWAIENGYDDSSPKYVCTVDRIDNNGNYTPDNCRIVPQLIQCNNRQTNHLLEYEGSTHTISEWARITGINKHTIRRRIDTYGWSVQKALTEPLHHKRNKT